MKSRFRRAVGLGTIALLLAGSATVLAAGAANAASPTTGLQGKPYLGKLKITGGSTSNKVQMDTFNPCPATASYIGAQIDGTGWTAVTLYSASANGLSTSGPMTLQSSDTLPNIASAQTPALTLNPGTYQVTLFCIDGAFARIGEFDGVLTVNNPNTTFSSPTVTAPAATTTTIATSPSSPQTGSSVPVTITATVSPSTATGSVDFYDGATKLNATSVPVSGGTAAFTATLAPGSHGLKAQYTSDDVDNFAGSTSAVSTFVVNAPATSTSTALGVNPASGATTIDTVNLTATVTPSAAAGSVQFYDNGPATPVLLGTVAVSGGTAVFSISNPAVGTYKFQAKFVPTNSNTYAPSTSPQLADYAVSAYAGVSASETLQATVAGGALTITAGGAVVDLGTLALNTGNTLLVSAPKDLNTVTVTDTRPGSIGWTASGQVNDFTKQGDATKKINGYNLGWTPRVLTANAGQTVNAGPVVPAGTGLAPGVVPPASPAVGLGTSRTLASSPAGASVGTATLTAAVVLQAPTTTVAGTYTATLTLTAI